MQRVNKNRLRPSAGEQALRRAERRRIQRLHGGKWTREAKGEFQAFLRRRACGCFEGRAL